MIDRWLANMLVNSDVAPVALGVVFRCMPRGEYFLFCTSVHILNFFGFLIRQFLTFDTEVKFLGCSRQCFAESEGGKTCRTDKDDVAHRSGGARSCAGSRGRSRFETVGNLSTNSAD